MNKVNVLYNQDYADHPEDFPGKKKLLEKIKERISKGDGHAVMQGIRFQSGPTGNIHDYVAEQIRAILPDLKSGKIATCFGDSGNGLVLGAFDQIARQHKQETGTELSDITGNAIYLAPGGTYNHGPIAMGTDQMKELTDFVGNDNSGYKNQTVRMRNARVQKNKVNNPHKITETTNHPFFAFAGMFFDAYILDKNEKLGRKDGYIKNSLKVINEALREVFGNDAQAVLESLIQAFGSEIFVESDNEQRPERNIPQSKLRAFTTLPRWGMARFEPEVESLDSDEIFIMESEQAGPVGMLKIAAAVNIIGASRSLLRACLQQAEKEVKAGKTPAETGIKGILRKFNPKKISYYTEKFDPKLLGGLNYSTDGFPHQVHLEKDEEGRLEIYTIPDSKVQIVRKVA